MVMAADLVQISVIAEVDGNYGTTPAGNLQIFPLTSEGVAANVEVTNSDMMNADRQVLDSIVTNITAEGDLSTELTLSPALQILIDSAMANASTPIADSPGFPGTPGGRVENHIGITQKSFTLEKRFPDPNGNGSQYLYHRVRGCVCNTMNVTVSPGEPATISFGVLGITEQFYSDTGLDGSALDPVPTYDAASEAQVLRGPDTITLSMTNSDGLAVAVGVDCFGDFSFDLNNNYRGIQCLGTLGNKEVAIGQAEVTMAGTVHFTNNELLELLLDQSDFAMLFEMQDTTEGGAEGNFFSGFFPRSKVSANSIVAGGTGTDVVNDMTFASLFNSEGGDNTSGSSAYDETSLRIINGRGPIVEP